MSKRKISDNTDDDNNKTSPITSKKVRNLSKVEIELPKVCSAARYSTLIRTTFDKLASCDGDATADDDDVYVDAYYYFLTLLADFNQKKFLKQCQDLQLGRKELIDRIRITLTSSDRRIRHSEKLYTAFQRLIDNHHISVARDEYIFDVFVSTLRFVERSVQTRLLDTYLLNLDGYLAMHHECQGNKWMHASTLGSFTARSPLDRFLIRIEKNQELDDSATTSEQFIDSLISLSFRILDLYGVEMNEFASRPRSVQESFTMFVRDLLKYIFKISNYACQRTVIECVNKCLDPSNDKRSIYIDQLDILLNSQLGLKYFSTLSVLEERKKLNTSVIEKLTDHYEISHTKKQQTTGTTAKERRDLFGIKEDAIRLLYALRLFFFTSDKSKIDQFAVLVDFLEQFCTNREEEVRSTAIKSLVTLLRALNAKPSQDKHLVPSSFKTRRQLALNDNQAPSKKIMKLLRKHLRAQSASVKSAVYQSMYILIKSNLALADDVCDMFAYQLEYYTIVIQDTNLKKGEAHFDLSKCLSDDATPSRALVISEPVDVLFHCALLCLHRSTNSPQTIITHNVTRLSNIISAVVNYYSSKDSMKIYDVYKAQLLARMKRSAANSSSSSSQDRDVTESWSPAFFKAIHQLQLGFYDSIIEKFLASNQFGVLPKILEKYEATSTLISADIENLVCEAMSVKRECEQPMPTKTGSQKRKHDGSIKTETAENKENTGRVNSRALKRFKSAQQQQQQEQDKENEPPRTKVATYERLTSLRPTKSRLERGALSVQHPNKETTTTTTTTMKRKAEKQQIMPQSQPPSSTAVVVSSSKRVLTELASFANIQFEHTHRISNTSLLKMFTLYLGSSTTHWTVKFKTSINSMTIMPVTLMAEMSTLVNSDRFAEYLSKLVETKLKQYVEKNDTLYDPLSFTPLKTFKMLSALWMGLMRRITGSDGDKTLLKSDHLKNFCVRYITRTYKMVSFCRSIWSIVNTRFPSMCQYLSNIEYYNKSMSDGNWETDPIKIERKEGDVLAKEIMFLMRTVKFHLSTSIITMNVASKCCANILSLIGDIMESAVNFSPVAYTSFNEWLIVLAQDPIAANEDVGKAVFNLLVHIGRKHDSPLTNLKYFALDLMNFVNENDIRSRSIEQMLQLQFFRRTVNIVEYHKLFSASIDKTLNECKWTLERTLAINKEFGVRPSIHVINKLIEQTVHTLAYLLHSVSNIQSAEIVLDLMVKFYDFMTFFSQSPLVYGLDYQHVYHLKMLIRFISINLQMNLSTELNRIRALIIQQEQLDTKKTNANDLINIIKFKQIITKLVASIDTFEQSLKTLGSSYQNIVNLLEGYQVFISSLEINFDSKVTRTVSENQLNNLLIVV